MALNALNAVVGLPGEVLKGTINAAVGTVGNDGILEIARNAYRRATQKAILTTVAAILQTTLSAMIGYLGPVDSIWKAIIDNPANQELFDTLKKDWWKVARFFVDLLEPMKRFVSAASTDGTPPPEAVRWNDYNELDLSQPMNRHAVMSQIQRFSKSVIEVFRQKDLNVGRFVMDTQLETDSGETAVTITALKRKDDKVKVEETWLFVNGIAGELYWNHLAVSKIQDFFFDPDTNAKDTSDDTEHRRTVIKGIYNRSDGILWDLIECGGERRAEESPNTTRKAPLSSRTKSSRDAQEVLARALRSALSDSKTSRKDIIMIAHSQGCLLLRLALEEIHSDEGFRDVMLEHLHIFTFGNPAYDWDVHAYVASTEHFANELDYVAKLGVLRQYSSDPTEGVNNDLTYCSRCRKGTDEKHRQAPGQLVFVNNKKQTGHLFGSQYSLQAKDYDCVTGLNSSVLLTRSERRSEHRVL